MGAFKVFVTVPAAPDTTAPTISLVYTAPLVLSMSFSWITNEATGTAYYLVDQVATQTTTYLEGLGTAVAVTAAGVQSTRTVSGLTASTNYYLHIFHKDESGNNSEVLHVSFTTAAATSSGTIVTSNAELAAAIDAGTETNILVAAGTYDGENFTHNKNRESAPLTIQALDPGNKPIFRKGQSVNNSHYITFKNLHFQRSGSAGATNWWIYESGTTSSGSLSSSANSASNITIDGCIFESPEPGNKTDSTHNPSYSSGMTRCLRFSNRYTHNITIIYNTFTNPYSIMDLRMNGNITFAFNTARGWYFDGVRKMGAEDTGRVEGYKVFVRNDFEDCLGVYNEQTASAPHPDHWQGFNPGSENPYTDNMVVYQNRMRPGIFRATQVQNGLMQTKLFNVGYVENLSITKNNIHFHSFEAGGEGILMERNTGGYQGHNGNPRLTVYKMTGQLIADSNLILGDFKYGTDTNVNGVGYELTDTNNLKSGTHAAAFAGASNPATMAELMSSFTPREAYAGYGALTTAGVFKNLPFRPMRPDIAVGVTALGSGNVRIDTLSNPATELMEPAGIVIPGNTTYTRTDIRHSAAGAYSWTTVTDVDALDVLTGISAGSRDFQHRKVNSAGEGLWSAITTITVT
jgi:hypothetical protein